MEFSEVVPFLLALVPRTASVSAYIVDLNTYKAAFNLSSWVPASVIETQIEGLLQTSQQLSICDICKDVVLQAVSLPMLIETLCNSQSLLQISTNQGLEVVLRTQWQAQHRWHSDKKPVRHLELDRGKVQPVRLTEFFPEETLAKDLKSELEMEMAGRRGEDLYVLRNDGVERVYKNNSQYYLQKKNNHKAHIDRTQRLQSHSDSLYTPKSRHRGDEEPPSSYPPRRQTQRKTALCGAEDRAPVECLEAKFARVSLQDITNVPLPGRTLRLSRNAGN